MDLIDIKLVFSYLFFPFLLYIIKKFIDEYWGLKKTEKKNASWLRVLNTSSEINKCFNELKSQDIYISAIGYRKRFNKGVNFRKKSEILVIIIATLIPIGLGKLININTMGEIGTFHLSDYTDYIITILYISFLSSIPFILPYKHSERYRMQSFLDDVEKFLNEKYSQEVNIQMLLDQGNKLLLKFQLLLNFTFFLYYTSVLYLAPKSIKIFHYSDLNNIYFILPYLVLLLFYYLILYYEASIWRNKIKDCIMKIINKKHKNSYPYVAINTSEVKGKLEDLFDNTSIILKENGTLKAIQWDSIKCLEIKENEIY